jgi:hypothetical protein
MTRDEIINLSQEKHIRRCSRCKSENTSITVSRVTELRTIEEIRNGKIMTQHQTERVLDWEGSAEVFCHDCESGYSLLTPPDGVD